MVVSIDKDPSCMQYNREEDSVIHGYRNDFRNLQNNTFQLPAGTILAGHYYVGNILDHDDFGITYIGCDLKSGMKVVIKEYHPKDVVKRTAWNDFNLIAKNNEFAALFETLKARFINEAMILTEFSYDHHVGKITDIFEAFNTIIIVMKYIEGISLENYQKRFGKMTFDKAWIMLKPLVETLEKIHRRGLIHKDINPSNILIGKDNRIILINFGFAYDYSFCEDLDYPLFYYPEYDPPEQYMDYRHGTWTDVYSLCATIYRMITGVVPVNAFERFGNDPLKYPSEMGSVIKPEQEAVLMCGLSLKMDKRIQSMNEFRKGIELADKGEILNRARPFLRTSSNHSYALNVNKWLFNIRKKTANPYV